MIFCAKNSVVIVNFGPLKWNISGIYYQNSTYGVSGESWHSGEQKRLMVCYNISTCRAARGRKPIHTQTKIRKIDFFSSESNLPRLEPSQAYRMKYPRGFLFYKPFLSQ